MRKQKSPRYVINIVDEKDLEKLIYGYALDEKRTVCFVEGKKSDEIFYICDFSAKVFVKHTKTLVEHVTTDQDLSIKTLTVNNIE